MDFSLALISGAINVFNRMNLGEYLDLCYDILVLGAESKIAMAIFVCCGHVLKRCSMSFKAVDGPTKQSIMRLIGRMTQMTSFNDIEYAAKKALIVYSTKYVTETFQTA